MGDAKYTYLTNKYQANFYIFYWIYMLDLVLNVSSPIFGKVKT